MPLLTSIAALALLAPVSLSEQVRTRIEALRAEYGFPGMSVGFVSADGVVGCAVTGMADVEAKRLLDCRDLMLAGSVGKTYCAAVMLSLLGEGKASLDAPISKWLGTEPWFSRLPNASQITLKMLMNHTSGVPEHVMEPEFTKAIHAAPDRVWKPAELLAFILDKQPRHTPAGSAFSYADTNYILVGMIAEKIAKRPIYDEVERRLLKPLKLVETRRQTSRTIQGLITGYSRPDSPFLPGGRTIIGGKFVVNPQFEWMGGGFAATTSDLARWARALYGGRVLKPDVFYRMLDGVPANTGRDDKYGLGVQIRTSDWGVNYGHSGWFPGYLTDVMYWPEKKMALAVQFNTDDPRVLKRSTRWYAYEVMKVLAGEP